MESSDNDAESNPNKHGIKQLSPHILSKDLEINISNKVVEELAKNMDRVDLF